MGIDQIRRICRQWAGLEVDTIFPLKLLFLLMYHVVYLLILFLFIQLQGFLFLFLEENLQLETNPINHIITGLY